MLPVLHLNGYKIAGPTVLARIEDSELIALLRGYGYEPAIVAGDEPQAVHESFARTLDEALDRIHEIQSTARASGFQKRSAWPMIVLRTPKGWTGPKIVDGVQVEGTFRAHQVPLADFDTKPAHLRMLEEWMHSYRPEELFDESGKLREVIAAAAPCGTSRMSANPNANGGEVLRRLVVPDFRSYALDVASPGTVMHESMRTAGSSCAMYYGQNPDCFRLFAPDEAASNRLNAVFEVAERCSTATVLPTDDHVSAKGRVMEILSEHCCEGWLEGYLLTGRYGVFTSYEAFIHIVDSMFNQHAKWLASSKRIPWRRPIASLNYLLSSHVWRQDHNGFTHQDPGFLDVVVNKGADVVRVYLPPDANTLLSVLDHSLRSMNYINVIIAGKQPELQWLDMDAAVKHCTRAWASGPGRAATKEPSRTWCSRVRATCRPWKRLRPRISCELHFQKCAFASSTSSI